MKRATAADLDTGEELVRRSCGDALSEMVPAFVVDAEVTLRFRRCWLLGPALSVAE